MEKCIFEIEMDQDAKDKIEKFIKAFDIDAHINEIEQQEQPEDKEWPQYGDGYYFINSDGNIGDGHFYISNNPSGKNRLDIGNCFRTREEAEFEVERLKVLAEMKKFAEPKDRDWDDNNEHWLIAINTNRSIAINTNSGGVYYTYAATYKSNAIYFESQERAQECVKAIGADRIKKYYIGIKE